MDVPDGYNRNRRHETWREVHGWSRRAKKRRDDLRKRRKLNREPGRFGKVRWDAYQHHQLFDMIMRANVGEMSARAGQWSALAGKIEATTADVQRVMERLMGAWRGQASVSSATATTRLMHWAGSASQTASQIAERMSSYTDAVGRAQARMPDPAFATAERNFRDGYTVTSTGGPSTAILVKQLLSDGMVSHEQARARKAEAVRVMETYEEQSKQAHDNMPHFPDVAPTTKPGAETGLTPTPTPGQPPSNPGPGPGPTTQPPYGPGTPGAGGNSSTSAAGHVNPALTGGGPAGGGGPGGAGGGYGGGLGGGLGSLGSGGSDIVRNTPGHGAPGGLAGAGGVPGRGPAGVGGAGGLGNAARGGGVPGAFGGMPVGHGAQGDEDKEHRNKYDPGMDFLDDLPPAYPPVFGA